MRGSGRRETNGDEWSSMGNSQTKTDRQRRGEKLKLGACDLESLKCCSHAPDPSVYIFRSKGREVRLSSFLLTCLCCFHGCGNDGGVVSISVASAIASCCLDDRHENALELLQIHD